MIKQLFTLAFLFCFSFGLSAQDINMTNGTFTQCTDVFYDSGGASGNYGDNENFITTICPDNIGDKIQLDFTAFSTQLNSDVLTIYDGDDTTAPPLGSFSGVAGPGLVQASDSNISGCLTIEFSSGPSGTTTGWEATISCVTPCQNIVANFDSSTPAADATNTINADVSEVITFNGSGTFSVDGTGATYEWNFGNGDTATGQSVNYAYNTSGIYNVTLTITDTNPLGCLSTNDINLSVIVGASTPGNPFVDAGDDVSIDCAGSCVDLSATFLDIGETNTYNISQIPFVPPFPFQGLQNSLNTNIDDAWSNVENLPFDLCFFSNIETQFQVGSNGVIRFDVNAGDTGSGSNDFGFNDNLPNNTDEALAEANIFTPCHDIDPSVGNSEEIAWEIIGTPPNRVLAVSFYQVPMYSSSCNNLEASHMAVFYETTNVIDIYIEEKPTCTNWNNGNAVVGIQNDAGTQAFVPPGRNTSDSPWTTSEEAWRFTPAGPSIVDFAWLDDTGAVLSTDPDFQVCPTAPSTTYTARVTYTNCNGDIVVVTDDVTVTTDSPFTVDLGNDIELCEGDADIVLDGDISSPTATYQWFLDNIPLAGETNPTLTVSSPNSGTYLVSVSDSGCTESDEVEVTFFTNPIVNVVDDYFLCDDAVIDGFTEFDLSTLSTQVIGAQTGVTVSYHLSQDDAEANNLPIGPLFTNTSNPQQIFIRIQNDGNTNCIGTGTVNLEVGSGIVPIQPDDLVTCDDFSNNGSEQFDLSVQTPIIVGTQTGLNVTYHLDQADADANTGALPNFYTNTSNPQTIFVRIEDGVNPNCYETISFELIVNPAPIATNVTPLEACDDTTPDGLTTFNLTDKSAEIINGQPDVVVTYYENITDAQNGVNALADGYMNTTPNTQIITVRVENTVTGCVNFGLLVLQVNANPIANNVSDIVVCDSDNDGFGLFDLSLGDSEAIGGQTGVSVSYHETEVNAQMGISPLPTSYSNIVIGGQLIYVRVEDDVTGCYAVNDLQLTVNPSPLITTVTPLELCDDNNPGDQEEDFTLSDKTLEILDGQVNMTVSYYSNLSDAESQINGLNAGSYTNTSTPQTIWYVIENDNTLCTSIGTFELVVNPLPVLVVPTPLEVCDDNVIDGLTEIDLTLKNPEISGNNPNYAVSYYQTQADAQSGTNVLPNLYTNTSDPQTIYVRVLDINTGCFDTTSLVLDVQQAPAANVPTPLYYCDPDNDGFGVFMLEDVTNEVTGGALDLTVTYHETQANAENGVDAIDTSVDYNNIVEDTQTIYVRVESSTISTNCPTVVELQLIVEPTPQVIEPTPLEACDDISADGFAQFDLTTKDGEILNGLDPLQYTVTYYETEVNAEAGTLAIGTPGAYTNTIPFAQTLWVRVDDTTTVGGCYKITTLILIVNPLPVLQQPSPLELCDVDNPGDEQEPFTLEEANAEILNGQTGITLTYYETQLDADNGTNPIASPYVNTMNAQTVYVRAVNDVTGCINTITLTLRVNPIPSPEANPDPIVVCDEDNDGFAEFDLEQRTVEIINGELDVTISYHETEADANNDINALASPYTNIVANVQQIYVRSENNLTGCYSLTLNTLELRVEPSPEVPVDLEDYVICDTDDNGFTQFDLTTKLDEILGSQDPTEVLVTFHLTQADGDSGADPIATPGAYTNASNPQTIYVRAVSAINGCVTTGEFIIRVELPPTAVQPTPLEQCDDLGEANDEITEFDLTLKDAEITGGNASWSVAYYETLVDAEAETNAIPNPMAYTNTSVGGNAPNPQTLYAVVTDTDTGCTDLTTLTIRVLPNPTPTASSALPLVELCDDINTGDLTEVFDLTINEALILNGEAGVTASYYQTEDEAIAGTNAIPDPTLYDSMTTPDDIDQVIYVRVTNGDDPQGTNGTGCFTIVEFTIQVNPLPDVVAVTDFIGCEVNTDGFYEFDLTSKDAEVLNGQDPSLFTVTYHISQTDADDLVNALVSPYTNVVPDVQPIYVAITDNATGCSISTPVFELLVQEGAEANSDGEPILYQECDDNVETDGDPSNDSTQFDLSTQDVEVLDGQDPMNYTVTYYATQEDADNGVNPLPTLYENTTVNGNIANPQVIYVRVDNDTMVDDGTGVLIDSSECYATSSLTLQVNPLPIVVLEEDYILCVDTNGTEILDPLVLDTGLSEMVYAFQWSLDGTAIDGATSSSYTPTQGGVYTVLVTDVTTSMVTMCTNQASTTVIESAPPTLSLTQASQAFSNPNVIEAIASGIGDYEYSLDNGSWQDSGIFTDVTPGEHTVAARDKNGCGYVEETITILDYPLFFTPNGDGIKDRWQIPGLTNSAKIYIFDRYGKLIKQLNPLGEGWDGTYNGTLMPTSDYWFTVDYIDQNTLETKQFKAHFTLKR